MPTNIGITEVIVVAVIILALFGTKKIPEFVRGVAKAIKEFRNASKDDK
jgi:sec-independent protein translocase protein TatA